MTHIIVYPVGPPVSASKDNYFITHGRVSNCTKFQDLTGYLAARINDANSRYFLVDWSAAAASNYPSLLIPGLQGSRFIKPAGNALKELVVDPLPAGGQGVPASKITVWGHSWGSYVSSEFAKASRSNFKALVGLDPAETTSTGRLIGNAYYNPKLREGAEHSFALVARNGLFGGQDEADTAHLSAQITVIKSDSGNLLWNDGPLHSVPIRCMEYALSHTDKVSNALVASALNQMGKKLTAQNSKPDATMVGYTNETGDTYLRHGLLQNGNSTIHPFLEDTLLVESLVPQDGYGPSPPREDGVTSARKERFTSRAEFLVASPGEQEPAKSQVPTSAQEWRELTDRIRAMEPWAEKERLIEQYMELSEKAPVSVEILGALAKESDPVLLDHHVLLLQRIIDVKGIQRLVELIDEVPENPARQELFLKVMENVFSPAAMPALRQLARNKEFTFKEPLLFYALRALARSGEEEDVRAIFDRINTEAPGDRQKLSFMVTAAVETSNPVALPFLLGVASGITEKHNEDARLIAIYTLRNYRDNPEADQLLRNLAGSPNEAIASAANEALVAVK